MAVASQNAHLVGSSILVELALNMKTQQIAGSEKSVQTSIRQDVSRALSGDADKVSVVVGFATSGSILVKIRLADGICGPMPLATVAQELERQSMDSASLLRQGDLTRHVTGFVAGTSSSP